MTAPLKIAVAGLGTVGAGTLKLLRANADAAARDVGNDGRGHDPAPVVKFFNPVGSASWLASELDSDGDTLFDALIDKSFGDDVVGEAHEVDDYAARIDGCE